MVNKSVSKKTASKTTVAKKTSAKKATIKATAAKKQAKGLGRGLSALLGDDIGIAQVLRGEATVDSGTKATTEVATPQSEGEASSTNTLQLKQLRAGKYQPRSKMEQEKLQELADSIAREGIMQPLLVRPLAGTKDAFEIIAGERRFRAAKIAGLNEVPVLIRDVSDEQAAIMALIENMQREDLNPLEEAKGIRRLIDEFNFTHEQAAESIGRSRSYTSNLLRLLNLAEPVQEQLIEGLIDMGHARALLALNSAEQILLAHQVVAKQLSVRETERLVKQFLNQDKQQKKPVSKERSRDVLRLEEALSDYLGTTVTIKVNAKQKGQLLIDFHDWEQLNNLLEKQGLADVIEN
ncbi:ParB/RepB/Spo0J family partition protein [Oligella urethralis]|uniref:ParB/RepB/Spo0J family partition protein n=1 Tax=Oligella urethralis TaxID=90245 RepID=UPI000E03013D|nr:ParB/RepB/Spo0J family partition protein [Oligella urethralis]SUA56145.1 Probable chromosome-partitioning protein parB [Oligella urethralis]